MVLRPVIALLVAAGCSQSLFEGNGGGGTGSGPCPSNCVADAHDFASGHWRYLEDHRDHTWTPMTQSGSSFTGADPANQITPCPASGGGATCTALPDALLVSSSGAMAMADPAIEWKADKNRVVELQLAVLVPAGSAPQYVRLYRNSREDALFTGTASPGAMFSQSITVDAITGDRFLVAIAPPAGGAMSIGVQLFVVDHGAAFPSTCQVALLFDIPSGTDVVPNACGGDFSAKDDTTGMKVMPNFDLGPYKELGASAAIGLDKYYDSTATLMRKGDFTLQMWIKHQMLDSSGDAAYVFSDLDLNNTGGIALDLYANNPGLTINAYTCTDATGPTFDNVSAAYSIDQQWHFVRVVHQGAVLSLCIDGTRRAMKSITSSFQSMFPPQIAENLTWTPQGSYFIGSIDDLRVFSTALPCE